MWKFGEFGTFGGDAVVFLTFSGPFLLFLVVLNQTVMNTIQSVKYGWVALTVCCLTGAYIGRGSELAKDKRGDQHKALIKQKEEFRRAREKWLAKNQTEKDAAVQNIGTGTDV